MSVVKFCFAFVQRVLMSIKAIYPAKMAQQQIMMVGTLCSSLDFFFFQIFILQRGFPGGSDSKESTCHAGDNPWFGKIPQRREWLPSLVFLPGEFHGQKSLVGHSPWGHKELNMTEQKLQLISSVVIVSGTQQRDSAIYIYMCTCSPPNSSSIQAEFCVLYSRSLLVIHLKQSSVYMNIPNSLTIPFPLPSLQQP